MDELKAKAQPQLIEILDRFNIHFEEMQKSIDHIETKIRAIKDDGEIVSVKQPESKSVTKNCFVDDFLSLSDRGSEMSERLRNICDMLNYII